MKKLFIGLLLFCSSMFSDCLKHFEFYFYFVGAYTAVEIIGNKAILDIPVEKIATDEFYSQVQRMAIDSLKDSGKIVAYNYVNRMYNKEQKMADVAFRLGIGHSAEIISNENPPSGSVIIEMDRIKTKSLEQVNSLSTLLNKCEIN